MAEAEVEDLYDESIYADEINRRFGVDVTLRLKGKRRKWSDRIGELFKKHGKPWNTGIEMQVKRCVAEAVAASPQRALHAARADPILALVGALAGKLGLLHGGRPSQ